MGAESTRIVHNKLVRDTIPEIIRSNGYEPTIRILNDAEFEVALREKFVEEAKEVKTTTGFGVLDELADLMELIDVHLKRNGWTRDDLERVQTERRASRGGFELKIFLEYTEARS